MTFSELHSSIVSRLIEEFDKLKHTVEHCSFHIHVHGKDGRYTVKWSTSSHQDYSTNVQASTISMLHFEILPELFGGRVMLKVSAARTRLHLGERERTYGDSYNWYRQEWRHEKVVVAADAAILWTILESNADMTKIASEVMES